MPELEKRALIIEDDESISYLLSFLLQKAGFSTSVADDGAKALKLIDSAARPHLVILDAMLPFQDGFTLLEHLRSKPDWIDVPVLMLTAKSMESDMLRGLNGGANDYMVKPFQPNEFLIRVKRICKTMS